MAQIVDDRTIINKALARIGASPIGALDEDTKKCDQAKAVYFDRVETILGIYSWSFAGKTYRLDALAATSGNGYDAAEKKFITGWRYAYSLPGTRLGPPRRVMTDPRMPITPLREFFLEEDRLYADVTPLWAAFTVRVSPQIWLPAFRLAVTIAVAADLCVPITHDKGLADALREEAHGTPQENGRGGLIGKAIALDHAGTRQAAPLWQDPLTEARWS